MSKYTKEDIMRIVEEEDVEFIRLQFTDMYGTLKNIAITSSQLEKALNNKCMFDGSSVEQFARIEESDMYLHPDLDTFEMFPWRPQQGKVARFLCDVYRTNGEPFEGDPRYVLKKAVDKAHEMGFSFNVGPELEFFLFDTDDKGMPTNHTEERAGYFDVGPLDLGENVRRDMILTLEDMGFEIESSHHEVAPGQHEIDFKYGTALEIADDIQTFKLAVRTIAKRHGLHATFMPKPKASVDGSGMHINMSMTKNGLNAFYDPMSEDGLSKTAYYFIGGIMQHIKAITAITNPLVNSYKRLVPGYMAPVYISWSKRSTNPLIRVPEVRGMRTRMEFRSPDPSCNPYLALAVCLEAGLEGIRNEIMPPACINEDLNRLTVEQAKERGVEKLPGNLKDALECLKQDELIMGALGTIGPRYIKAKMGEWNDYSTFVSQWEVNQYLRL